MVCSLDGFIAKKDNSISWLESKDHFEEGVTLTEEEISEFIQGIDCYVMGSRTYEHALKLGWPYGEVPVHVLSSRPLTSDKPSVSFHSEEPENLVNNQLKSQYKNIWMVGGAALTKEFLRLDLADDLIVSIMPVLLGDGLLFFDYIGQEKQLHLKEVKAFKDGMVEMWYEVK